MLARAHKKFLCEQHSEIYLLTLTEQDKTKMELPLDMVSKHAFWYPICRTIAMSCAYVVLIVDNAKVDPLLIFIIDHT